MQCLVNCSVDHSTSDFTVPRISCEALLENGGPIVAGHGASTLAVRMTGCNRYEGRLCVWAQSPELKTRISSQKTDSGLLWIKTKSLKIALVKLLSSYNNML